MYLLFYNLSNIFYIYLYLTAVCLSANILTMELVVRDRIVAFLREIGLTVTERTLVDPTFLPGVTVESGTIVFDPERLLYPGDLLHEAGHMAVVPADERRAFTGDVGPEMGYEIAAIAWSYAASVFLELPLDVVFHAAGYKGASDWLGETFQKGGAPGVPILEWRGLTDYQRVPASESLAYFPKMKKWLCEATNS